MQKKTRTLQSYIKKIQPKISWSIKGMNKSYNPNSGRYSLCLLKKLKIDDLDKILLNKHSKVIAQCHHRSKQKLKLLVANKKDDGITW